MPRKRGASEKTKRRLKAEGIYTSIRRGWFEEREKQSPPLAVVMVMVMAIL